MAKIGVDFSVSGNVSLSDHILTQALNASQKRKIPETIFRCCFELFLHLG
jgi:hypothetical protein